LLGATTCRRLPHLSSSLFAYALCGTSPILPPSPSASPWRPPAAAPPHSPASPVPSCGGPSPARALPWPLDARSRRRWFVPPPPRPRTTPYRRGPAPPLGHGRRPRALRVVSAGGCRAASARGVQGGHGGGNMHRLLGLDTMPHLPLHVMPGGGGNAGGAPASLWPPAGPRPIPTPPLMDSQIGMGPLGQHDVLSSLGLKLPPPSSSPAASYYSDQLHAVVSSAAGRPHEYDGPGATSLPCTTAATSLRRPRRRASRLRGAAPRSA